MYKKKNVRGDRLKRFLWMHAFLGVVLVFVDVDVLLYKILKEVKENQKKTWQRSWVSGLV